MGILLGKGQLHHGNHAILNWMADSAVTVRDNYGNVRFDKEAAPQKIDGMVCLAMGLSCGMLAVPTPAPRVAFL
jgi:phage terminase large subunit-like protein